MAIELTTVPTETSIADADELYFNDVSETPDALNRITFANIRSSVFASGATIDFGAGSSFELPNSAAPTVNADGEIAIDTTITDMSHGLIKYFSTEECAVIAVPVAELTGMANGDVIKYNATNDEFEIGAGGGGGIGGSTGATDNAILRADGTGGSTVQSSGAVVDDSGFLAMTTGGNATTPTLYSLSDTNTGLAFMGGDNLAVVAAGNDFLGFSGVTNLIQMASDIGFGWSPTGVFAAGSDTGLSRAGAGIVGITNGSTGGGALSFIEMTAPAAPAANGCYLYTQDNGAGKTQLMALFSSGAAQQVAIQP